jgi:uncharacterized protein involved in response to NO
MLMLGAVEIVPRIVYGLCLLSQHLGDTGNSSFWHQAILLFGFGVAI